MYKREHMRAIELVVKLVLVMVALFLMQHPSASVADVASTHQTQAVSAPPAVR